MENEIIKKFAANTDFFQLTGQKRTLIKLSENPLLSIREKDDIEGLLNFIDAFQDMLVDEVGIDEGEVYPYLEKDNEDL